MTRGFILTVGMLLGCSGPDADYLTPSLRARVEQLKQESAVETTQETVAKRCGILWEWSNALSMTGIQMNPDLPRLVIAPRNPDSAASDARLKRIDGLIQELILRDEVPIESFGTLKLDAPEPVVAGSFQTFTQQYIVGDLAVEPGGGLLIGRHFQSYAFPSGTNFQTTDPAAEGFLSVRSSNPIARFEPETIPWNGLHGIAEVGTAPVVFRLRGARLTSGQTVSVKYGETSGGSKGLRIQNYSSDAVPLPIYVDFKGDQNFIILPIQTYAVAGREVHGVHGFAPSTVGIGERFTLSVRSEDRYWNRASGPITAYEIQVNGEDFGKIDPGDDAIHLVQGIQFAEPGVYRFSFRSNDGAITGHSNPIWVRKQVPGRIYWGDTHGHSGFAEGLGTPEAYFRFGRDESRLDFLTHSEHDLWMDDFEWEVLRQKVQQFSREGEFIAFLGYEWTVRTNRGGHHNVLFRTPEGRNRVAAQTAPDLAQLYQGLARGNDMRDVLIIPHAHMAGDWTRSNHLMERLVEIMSGHGNFEWFGRRYLAEGHEVGFVAASDDHFSHPGYSSPFLYGYVQQNGLAAVMAPEKTTDAIFSALRARHSYATTGQRIILDLTLNGAPMGSRIPFAPQRRIRGQVMGTAPIDRVTLVKNGADIWTRDFLTASSGNHRILEVAFWSDSDPGRHANPRAWRRWDGTLDVNGAQIENVTAPSLRNRVLENVVTDPQDPSRIHFTLMTRGSDKSILLELNQIAPDPRIVLKLARAGRPILEFYRRLTKQGFPSVGIVSLPGSAEIELRDMRRGMITLPFADGRHPDVVTARWIRSDAPKDQGFEFIDIEAPSPGDNYYVRAEQLDGGIAWSSPVWVGQTSNDDDSGVASK